MDYIKPIVSDIYKTKNYDCFTTNIKVNQDTYYRESIPLRKRLWRPYLVY